MTTPYEKVFDSFLSKIEDDLYSILSKEDAESDFIKLLNSAIIRFDFPKVDILNKDDLNQIFNVDLNMQEVEILGNLMVLEWVKRKIKSVRLLEQMLNSKDFSMTSQANHLKMLLELKIDSEKEVNSLMTKYSYISDRKSLFGGLSGSEQ
jgi:hypothetical protein